MFGWHINILAKFVNQQEYDYQIVVPNEMLKIMRKMQVSNNFLVEG